MLWTPFFLPQEIWKGAASYSVVGMRVLVAFIGDMKGRYNDCHQHGLLSLLWFLLRYYNFAYYCFWTDAKANKCSENGRCCIILSWKLLNPVSFQKKQKTKKTNKKPRNPWELPMICDHMRKATATNKCPILHSPPTHCSFYLFIYFLSGIEKQYLSPENIFKFFSFRFLFLSAMCVSVIHKPGIHGSQKTKVNSLELKLWVVINHHIGIENWTWVPCKSTKYS